MGREMMFGRLDNLPNWDCMGLTTESFGLTRSLNDGMEAKTAHLMRQWDMPAPDMAHSERHE